jgi:predicted RNA-binding Zn ribbon-like protein
MLDSRPPPLFLADDRGLDFLNTRAVPAEAEVEWLASGDDLLAWLEAAELVDRQALAEIRGMAAPGELDAVAAQARALREWWRGFVQRHRGKPLGRATAAELEPLNRLLARDSEFVQLVAMPRGEPHADVAPFVLASRRHWAAPESLLLPIAKAMAQLLVRADFSDVRKCENAACVLHFLDTTRGRRRRWCSMAVCGNRAKQAAHRDRVAGR